MSVRTSRSKVAGSLGSPGAAPGVRGARRRSGMSSHDCTVLALLLVERLSLAEAAEALDIPVTRLRRDYEAALVRVRRSIAPVLARADLSRALSRPAPSWRKAS